MAHPRFLDDPEHWRNRAEEARTVAETMNDPASREIMQRIAKDYLRMAERAQARYVRQGRTGK
jgi:RNA-splicing ligase RtcB